MSLKQGEVLLSDKFECHKGVLTALEGQKLVSIFLGTCKEGQIPAVTPFMNTFGWFQTQFWQAEVEILLPYDTVEENRRIIRNTLISCQGKRDAGEAAVRFARKQVMDAKGEMLSLAVHVIQLGHVAMDGTPMHKRMGRLLAWDQDCGTPLDAIVAGLDLE